VQSRSVLFMEMDVPSIWSIKMLYIISYKKTTLFLKDVHMRTSYLEIKSQFQTLVLPRLVEIA